MRQYFIEWTDLDDAVLHVNTCHALKNRDDEILNQKSVSAQEFVNDFSSLRSFSPSEPDTIAYVGGDPESLIREAVDEALGCVTIHECAAEKLERDVNELIDKHAGY